jgi:hypothetical protein
MPECREPFEGVAMDPDKAHRFAKALTALCHQHGVMIWTAYATAPIMAGEVNDGRGYHYEAESPEFGNAAVIRRVLTKSLS